MDEKLYINAVEIQHDGYYQEYEQTAWNHGRRICRNDVRLHCMCRFFAKIWWDDYQTKSLDTLEKAFYGRGHAGKVLRPFRASEIITHAGPSRKSTANAGQMHITLRPGTPLLEKERCANQNPGAAEMIP